MPPIISIVVIVFAAIVFVAMLVDTLIAGDRRGGQPPATLTYRAYGA
jgi:hypothetical protein